MKKLYFKENSILSLCSGNSFDIIKEKDLLFIITEILRIENCRVSEVLSATWQDLHHGRFLILQGKKKSAPVIIRDREILRMVSNLPKTHSQLIFYPVNYRQVYHYIKKYYSHQFENIKVRKNKKVTHAFRYINLRAIDNDQEIKVILHHNSKRSGVYYKNKLKGS